MKLREIKELALAEEQAPLRYWDYDRALICSFKDVYDAWIYNGSDQWSDFEDTWKLMERGDEIDESEAQEMIAAHHATDLIA